MSWVSSARKMAAIGAATAALATGITLAGPAVADTTATARNGVCEVGEFCLYWGPNLTGSVSDFKTSIPDYGSTQPSCYEFKGPGTGRYECVKNNAASAWNRRSSGSVRVYYNSYYGGTYDPYIAGESGNLNGTLYLENASHKFL